ncbi:hypothetical protein AB1Y20_017933 [Prymnesium parvum]|uniref:Uncharacterized protein n=1 Tax=Prymnesium parvum TaxID=97485 RepID=A0AB34JQN6_PRYPA
MNAAVKAMDDLHQKLVHSEAIGELFKAVGDGGGLLPSGGHTARKGRVEQVKEMLAERKLRNSASLPMLDATRSQNATSNPSSEAAVPLQSANQSSPIKRATRNSTRPTNLLASLKGRQFTYGIKYFDDETVHYLLHVDHEARLRPALLVSHQINELSIRDVQRADILSRINPPSPEERFARELELMLHEERTRDSFDEKPPAQETLRLLKELELIGVFEELPDRSKRMLSIPEVRDVSIYQRSDRTSSPIKSRGKSLNLRCSKTRLSFNTMRAMQDLVSGPKDKRKSEFRQSCCSSRLSQSPPRMSVRSQTPPRESISSQSPTRTSVASQRMSVHTKKAPGMRRSVAQKRESQCSAMPPRLTTVAPNQSGAAGKRGSLKGSLCDGQSNGSQKPRRASQRVKISSMEPTCQSASNEHAPPLLPFTEPSIDQYSLPESPSASPRPEATSPNEAPSAEPSSPPSESEYGQSRPSTGVSAGAGASRRSRKKTRLPDIAFAYDSPAYHVSSIRYSRALEEEAEADISEYLAFNSWRDPSLTTTPTHAHCRSRSSTSAVSNGSDEDEGRSATSTPPTASKHAGGRQALLGVGPFSPHVPLAPIRCGGLSTTTQQGGLVHLKQSLQRALVHSRLPSHPPSMLVSTATVDLQRGTYMRACEEASVAPVSRVLNHLGAPRLALRYYGIGARGAGPLAAVLPSNVSWRVLSLADNCLQPEGGICLAKALAQHSKLTEIDLAGNNLGAPGARAVLNELANSDISTRRIRRLRLGRNLIADGVAEELSTLLERGCRGGGCYGGSGLEYWWERRLMDCPARLQQVNCKTLQSLDLQDNQMSVLTALPLSLALGRPECPLTELDMSWNSLRSSGVRHIAASLITNTKLETLLLSWNTAGQKGGIEFAEALRVNKKLRRLDLQHNDIDSVAAVMLADALKDANEHLTSLDLSHNPLGQAACESVMRALAQNSSLVEIGLQAVDAGLIDGARDASLNLVSSFDASNPGGEYRLDLSKPWERFIALKLQNLARSRSEPWEHATIEFEEQQAQAPSFFRSNNRQLWSDRRELPERGILRFKYSEGMKKQRTAVHYSLDLADSSQREIAISLWQKAVIEPGENWMNETLDGKPFQMDESNLAWDLPTEGLLEVDYVSYDMKFEAFYDLDLADLEERTICANLIERAKMEPGDNFVQPTFNGKPLTISELEGGRWRMPSKGIFRCHFICSEPQHVSTRHYCLDLGDREDRALAQALRECAANEPGENLMNEQLNGQKIHFDEEQDCLEKRHDVAWSRRAQLSSALPEDGILEFDYVVLKPRRVLPSHTPSARRERGDSTDKLVASKLQQLFEASERELTLDTAVVRTGNHSARLMTARQQVQILHAHGVDHIADDDFHVLQQALTRATKDIDRLQKLRTVFRDSIRFPPYQAIEIVKLMEYPKEASMCIRELWPYLADPDCLGELLGLLPSNVPYREELRLELGARHKADIERTQNSTTEEPTIVVGMPPQVTQGEARLSSSNIARRARAVDQPENMKRNSFRSTSKTSNPTPSRAKTPPGNASKSRVTRSAGAAKIDASTARTPSPL